MVRITLWSLGASLAVIGTLCGCAAPMVQPPESEPFTYEIDQAVEPAQTELPGLSGGPPRAVAVVVGPDGSRDEFVHNEVIFRPRSEDELNAFLDRHGGTVLRDGTPILLPEVATESSPPSSSGWYLIRVDPSHSPLDDFAAHMEQGGSRGLHLYSSEDAARLGALLAREKLQGRGVGPNIILAPFAVEEHPDGSGGFLDAEGWWWMTDQDLSLGVVRAWRYLSYKGVPPPSGTWTPPTIAIVDAGFDIDASGNPLSAAADFFPPKPLQIDLVDHDFAAGGINTVSCGGAPCPWHGQEVFGVAAARPNNRFGGAGTGGRVARPLLVRIDFSAYGIADGIRTAVLNGADVINVSVGGGCTVARWICALPPHDVYSAMKSAVLLAASSSVVVVTVAGNQGIDLATADFIPCQTPMAICVGAIDQNASNVFNFGSSVDIWAPHGIYSTVTPPRAGQTGTAAICCFLGTSAASPFVAGVVALMKGLNPSLTPAQVLSILQETANPSPDQRVETGYVNAFRAVERVSPNQPPTVSITIPTDGASVSHNREVFLHADAVDPDGGPEFHGRVVFTSNRDGELCSTEGFVTGCKGPALSLGSHVITATGTDPFGATASDSISVQSINQAPIARITFPPAGATAFADQTINMRGYGFDWDEAIPDTSLVWQSSIGGAIGTGKNILVTLDPGAHIITLTAHDSLGLTGQDMLVLTVEPESGHPTAHIVSPGSNDNFAANVPITFLGQGTDPEDGALSGPSLSWFSSIDGMLGNGTTLTTSLSGPTCGTVVHDITLRATDSDGHEAMHAIALIIGTIC